MTRTEIGAYLIVDPDIRHGQVTFKGTRIPVDTVLTYLGKGYAVEQILRRWPELTRSAIEEAPCPGIEVTSGAVLASRLRDRSCIASC